jgi:predicted kinase|tara:strand:- start:584 stop:1336 length:753 start_codon:yes stop_codon:yes gene_type:complete
MKIIKNYNDFLVENANVNEGVYDPGILKAFFMAGGPGSGKSYVATELFDFPKGIVNSVSYETGLKLVNNDNAFEKALKDQGLSPAELSKYAKDPEKWAEVMLLRDKAKSITKKLQANYLTGRLGQVIDGTGKDFKKIEKQRKIYQDLGYDTYMVFVNTSKEVALERNQMRERKLADEMVSKMWQDVQNNMGKFQRLFGSKYTLIVDNSSSEDNSIINLAGKEIAKHLSTPIENNLGKIWIKNELENKKRS